MSEFPPAGSYQNNARDNPNFLSAVERARSVIAKIDTGTGNKRALEDPQDPSAKKLAGSMGGPVVGVSGGGRASGGPGGSQIAPEQTINEYMQVPDKMVGLIIGRGGEQISRLQAESGCKIQMAPDSGGKPERMCTLTGSRENVNRAREMVNIIVNQRGRDGGPPDSGPPQQRMGGGGQNHEEIMIPGPKVGLIIGKGGETIKQLQEKSGAKMVVIQDGPNPEFEKPLRITGDAQKVEYAKQLVYDLIAEKEAQFQGSRGGGKGPGGNQMWGGNDEFNQQGGPEGHEQRRDGPRGPPRNGGSGDSGVSSYGSWSGGPDDGKVEVTFSVSNTKCGIIIGRGGEVIKQINSQSGAHCELDRRTQNMRGNRVFFIRGERENVEEAKRIILEKVAMPLNFVESNGQNNSGEGANSGGGSGDYSGGYGGGQGAPSSSGAVSGGVGGPMGWNYPQWHPPQPQQQQEPQHQQQQSVPINPSTGQPDYSLQWIDFYTSTGQLQEAEKIKQQLKANKAAGIGAQQPAQHPQAAVPSTNGAGAGGAAVPSVNSAAGGEPQQDYSAQWAAYYRSRGQIKEAEDIEAQMKQKSSLGGSSSAGTPNSGGSYGGSAPYQPQTYQQQHYQGYGGYPGYPSHQAHPAPPDQQQ